MSETVTKNLFHESWDVQEVTATAVPSGHTSGGKKFDGGKADLSLVPRIASEEMARAFMVGEKKYGRYNYTAGLQSHRLIAAAMRHLHAYQEGEDMDPEGTEFRSKHLGHALASIAMLLHCEELGTLTDTRRKK